MDLSRPRSKKGVDGEGIYTDNVVKFCPECKKCWEMIEKVDSDRRNKFKIWNMTFLTDFPSYGKKREVCNYCLGKPTQLVIQKKPRWANKKVFKSLKT
jgi:hypothetical protein